MQVMHTLTGSARGFDQLEQSTSKQIMEMRNANKHNGVKVQSLENVTMYKYRERSHCGGNGR